jgi:hypothetical protein
MLALRTGWTDRTIADGITDDFRRACHHALYAEHLAAPYHEAQQLAKRVADVDITEVSTKHRAAIRSAQKAVAHELAVTRRALGLTDGPEAVTDPPAAPASPWAAPGQVAARA